MVTFPTAISLGFRRYFEFSGRSTRAEYWWWILFASVTAFILTIVDIQIGTASEMGFGVLYSVFVLATFIPSLAVLVRRLHDVGKSGWFSLIGLIPLVGAIVVLVLILSGSEIENKYGSPRSE